MGRELRLFEVAATRTHDHASFMVAVVLELDGGPSPRELCDALGALQVQEPLLQVRISKSGGRYRYESDGVPPIPLSVVEGGGGREFWLDVVGEELNRRIDDRVGPLGRCRYVLAADGERSAIVLSLHHAIVDAVSGEMLLHRLLERCAAREDNEVPSAGPLPCLEDRLPPGFRGVRGIARRLGFMLRQMGDEAVYRLWEPSPKTPVALWSRCHPLPVRLSRIETAALVRATRRRRVTLKGAIDAALLLAVRRHLLGGRTGRLRYMTIADLRRHLEPPLPAEVLGAVISLMRHTIAVSDADDFWRLARRVTSQVEAVLRRGDKFTSFLLADAMMRIALRQERHRMATVAASYSAPIAFESQYGKTRVLSMHGFVSNFSVGPLYTAQARLFRGELLLDIVYLDTDMDRTRAELVAEEILGTLRDAAAAE